MAFSKDFQIFWMAVFIAASSKEFLGQVAQYQSGPLIHEQKFTIDCVPRCEVHRLKLNVGLVWGRKIEIRQGTCDGYQTAHVVQVVFSFTFL